VQHRKEGWRPQPGQQQQLVDDLVAHQTLLLARPEPTQHSQQDTPAPRAQAAPLPQDGGAGLRSAARPPPRPERETVDLTL
jgi:hypothetical protein